MFNQFVPIIIGSGFTVAGNQALVHGSGAAGPVLYTPLGLQVADNALDAWLAIPPNVITDAELASGRCPASLRIWRTGSGGGGGSVVAPTLRLGILKPATYTPDVGANGGGGAYTAYGTGSPKVNWLGAAVTDSATFASTQEVELDITPIGLSATYGRGQVVIHVTLPSSVSGAVYQIWGCGFRS